MRSVLYLLLFLALGLVMTGCATTYYTYRLPLPGNLENTDIVAAAVSTFQDNGFTIMLANEKICCVSTEWKILTSGFSKALVMAFGGRAETRRMKISLSADTRIGTIKINPVVETIRESLYGAGAPSVETLSEKDQELVIKLVREVAEKIGVDPSKIEIVTETK